MGGTILVAEDDETLRELLLESLQDEGYRASAVSGGAQALQAAAEGPIDLIVTDVRMAGMDGLELLAQMKQLLPKIRSIIITGYASDDAPVRAIQLEAWDYLYKPFSLDLFLATTRRVLQADGDRQRSRGLLAALSERWKKILVHSTDRLRERAYAAYYLAVRSRRLGLHAALFIWDRLEQLEHEREELKTATLAPGYEEIIEAVTHSHVPTSFPERPPGRLSRARFAEFFRRLERGDISGQQLSLAPFLRTLEPATLDQSPELAALYQTMWGD